VLSDVLNNFERVSDHCSNIAGCVIEISKYDALSMHEYTEGVKNDGGDFNSKVAEYKKIYSLKKA
jgi:phosphate:Na+ symporter